MTNLSIASYSFHGLRNAGMMDAFGYLETCRHRFGLATADIWNGTLGSDAESYLNDEFITKLKTGLAERELVLVNYAVDGCHVWEDDPAVRAAHHRLALRHLQAAEKLGARTVRIDTGGRDKIWTTEQFDTIADTFGEYARIGQQAGFRVGPESHWGAELIPDNMEALARAVNHPAFGVLIHLGRWETASIEEGDRRLAPWAMHTHIDQQTIETRLESAMHILLDAGYAGCWGVEYHTGKDEYAGVGQQLAAVRQVLAAPHNSDRT